MSIFSAIRGLFEDAIDSDDRKKIERRTQGNHDGYDYRLDLGEPAAGEPFRFLAVGDSGSGGRHKPDKFRVANVMAQEESIDLVLHLGDLVYLSGSKEGYPSRFIKPYRQWLQRGDDHSYDDMVFKKPFLPIYGNHDYYDFARIALPGAVSHEIGTGSRNGRVFEKAFVETGNSVHNGKLPYRPGQRTRIPNRYYWFTYGNCAFFALDSNTLDGLPETPPQDSRAMWLRRKLAKERSGYLKKQLDVYEEARRDGKISAAAFRHAEEQLMDDLAESEKEAVMLKKALKADAEDHDSQQLEWLRRVMGHSDVAGKWKIVYLHHPLYVSEESHTDDPERIGIRKNLRQILVEQGVHLVLSGHAHCFEWVRRAPAEGGSSGEEQQLSEKEGRICYIISGGGGRKLRGSVLEEEVPPFDRTDADDPGGFPALKKQIQFLDVADSIAYAEKFHFLKVEVRDDVIKVFPVGVTKEEQAESPLGVGRLERQAEPEEGDQDGMLLVKKSAAQLDYIAVFRNKAPQPQPPFESE